MKNINQKIEEYKSFEAWQAAKFPVATEKSIQEKSSLSTKIKISVEKVFSQVNTETSSV